MTTYASKLQAPLKTSLRVLSKVPRQGTLPGGRPGPLVWRSSVRHLRSSQSTKWASARYLSTASTKSRKPHHKWNRVVPTALLAVSVSGLLGVAAKSTGDQEENLHDKPCESCHLKAAGLQNEDSTNPSPTMVSKSGQEPDEPCECCHTKAAEVQNEASTSPSQTTATEPGQESDEPCACCHAKTAEAQNDALTTSTTAAKPDQEPMTMFPTQPGQSAFDIFEMLPSDSLESSTLPKEEAILTKAPYVPPPITRDYSVLMHVPLVTTTKLAQLTSAYKYMQWTFNDTVPGPFIRARVGDVLELSLTNKDKAGNPHNIDCHALTGPGGGAALTTVEENQTKTARFKLLCPGLYVYHCAAAPVPVHIANGMYGLIYVQPAENNLPPVDREYYVMQSEFYHEPPEVLEDGHISKEVLFSYPNALREEPQAIVFNGSESALTRDAPLKANIDESVRIFFGNAGPNLTSAFHVIGSIFHRVFQGGSVVDPPQHFIQTLSVPPGGSSIVDMKMAVPGTYALVDHSIFRLDKSGVGFLNVSGQQRPDIYQSTIPAAPCSGCKLHS